MELENRSTASSLDNANDKIQNTNDQTRLLQDEDLSGINESLFISNPATCEFEEWSDRSSRAVLEECSGLEMPQETVEDGNQETVEDGNQETVEDGNQETEEVVHAIHSSSTKSLRGSLKMLLKDSLSDLKLFFW